MIWTIGNRDQNDSQRGNRELYRDLESIPHGVPVLLGFNEPDLASQGNIPHPQDVRSCHGLFRLTHPCE